MGNLFSECKEAEYTVDLVQDDVNEHLSYVSVNSGDEKSASLKIMLFGAHVTSWKAGGKERLYLSSIAKFDGKAAIRGGVPLVFPQFGQPDKSMPQHGYGRISQWKYEKEATKCTSSSAYVKFTLIREKGVSGWTRASFNACFEVTLTAASMNMKLSYTTPEELQTPDLLLHTYFAVPDITTFSVKGFKGCTFTDKLKPVTNKDEVENREECVIGEEVDRIMKGTETTAIGDILLMDNSKPFMKTTKATYVVNTDNTEAQTGVENDKCVFWNAWINKSKKTGDLDDDAYKTYVCIEPLSSAKISKGQTLVLEQINEVV